MGADARGAESRRALASQEVVSYTYGDLRSFGIASCETEEVKRTASAIP